MLVINMKTALAIATLNDQLNTASTLSNMNIPFPFRPKMTIGVVSKATIKKTVHHEFKVL